MKKLLRVAFLVFITTSLLAFVSEVITRNFREDITIKDAARLEEKHRQEIYEHKANLNRDRLFQVIEDKKGIDFFCDQYLVLESYEDEQLAWALVACEMNDEETSYIPVLVVDETIYYHQYEEFDDASIYLKERVNNHKVTY